jgi:hypothetical protein
MEIKFKLIILLTFSLQIYAADLGGVQRLTDQIEKSYLIEKVPSLDCVYRSLSCHTEDVYDLVLYKQLGFKKEQGNIVRYRFQSGVGDKTAADVVLEVEDFRRTYQKQLSGVELDLVSAIFRKISNDGVLVEVRDNEISLLCRKNLEVQYYIKYSKGSLSTSFSAGTIMN